MVPDLLNCLLSRFSAFNYCVAELIRDACTPPSAPHSLRRWEYTLPVPAVPAPYTKIRRSLTSILATHAAAVMAAMVTTAVPWMSSLKQAISGRYFSNNLLAFPRPKSSKWRVALGKSLRTACTKVSTKSSGIKSMSERSRGGWGGGEPYSLPRTRGWWRPR